MTTVAEPAKAASVENITTSATTVLKVEFVVIDNPIACWRCGKVHMKSGARPWEFTCHRCHATNQSQPIE